MVNGIWMPRINQDKCKGCGQCIAHCPSGALRWSAGKARLLNPNACIYCATCESICPCQAIELPYLIVKAGSLREGEL